MALINTTTTGVLGTTVYGDGAGSLTVQKDGVTQGIFGNIPAFCALLSGSSQSVSTGTSVTLAANSIEYDTASRYNNTGSTVNGIPAYSYMPNVAGYYQFNAEINITGTGLSQVNITFNKNGSEHKRGLALAGTSLSQYCSPASAVIYMNGTTDYVSVGVYAAGTSPSLYRNDASTLGVWNYFQGILIKAV